jgi:hypothetical protein
VNTASGTLSARQRHTPSSTHSTACCIVSGMLYLRMSTKAKIWRCYFLDLQYWLLWKWGRYLAIRSSHLSPRRVSTLGPMAEPLRTNALPSTTRG